MTLVFACLLSPSLSQPILFFTLFGLCFSLCDVGYCRPYVFVQRLSIDDCCGWTFYLAMDKHHYYTFIELLPHRKNRLLDKNSPNLNIYRVPRFGSFILNIFLSLPFYIDFGWIKHSRRDSPLYNKLLIDVRCVVNLLFCSQCLAFIELIIIKKNGQTRKPEIGQ